MISRYLLGGAGLAILALIGVVLALRAQVAQIPGLERQVETLAADVAGRDAKIRDGARAIDGLRDRVGELEEQRRAAETAIARTASAIEETAAQTVEELRRVQDNPDCVYGADVARALRRQLDGGAG